MADLDRMHWLDRGLAEVDAAETLEDAREEARSLVIQAATYLCDRAESAYMLGLSRASADDGHPLATSIRDFKTAYNKLVDVHADIRASQAFAEERPSR